MRRKHDNASGSVGGGRGGNGAYRVLFQIPRPIVKKGDDRDPPWKFALAASLPPSSLVAISTREKGGPRFTNKVGDEDDESALNCDQGRFKLDKGSMTLGTKTIGAHVLAHRVDLAHDGLERRENRG